MSTINQPAKPDRSVPQRAPWSERLLAIALAIGSLGVLAVAAWLDPSARGYGTHTQIGLPPCAWAIWFDKPCPTCGMTTAFSKAGEGRWIAAFLTQPAGAALGLMTAAGFWLSGHAALTGSRLGSAAGSLLRPRVATLMVVGFIAAWGYKIVTWNTF
jgi:hypothetical protein